MLMGSGESGKSTILKQMKIIHQNGYSQDDLLMYKTTIYKNLLDCAKAIVNALQQFEIDLNAPPASAEANLALGDVANSSSSDATVVNITGGRALLPMTLQKIQNLKMPRILVLLQPHIARPYHLSLTKSWSSSNSLSFRLTWIRPSILH